MSPKATSSVVRSLSVFALGLLISLTLASKINQSNETSAAAHVSNVADELISFLEERIKLYEYGLRGARGHLLTLGKTHTSRDAFNRYMRTRDVDVEFPGARGFGFIRRVSVEDENTFLEAARADGKPDFTIRYLATHNQERYVIQYIEPITRNLQAVGLDIGSEINRRTAADSAVDSGKAQLTAPITLVQATGKPQQSFLMLIPLYETWDTPSTVAERRRAAFGWAYAPLLTEEILAKLPIQPKEFNIALHDITAKDNTTLFFSNQRTDVDQKKYYQQERIIPIYGRLWRLELSAIDSSFPQFKQVKPTYILSGGILVSLLLSFLAYFINANYQQKQKQFLQQKRLASIVESSSDAIIGTELTGIISSWNHGAEALFGYTSDEAIGQSLTSMIVSPQQHEDDLLIWEHLRQDKKISSLVSSRTGKNGNIIHVSISGAPIYDANNNLISASFTFRDITPLKEAEKRILDLNQNLEIQINSRTAELNQLNKLFSNVLNSATQVAIIATDPSGTITLFNAGAEKMLGYNTKELVGKYSPAIFHLNDEVVARSQELSHEYGISIEGFRVFVHKAEQGAPETRQWTYLCKDGSAISVSLAVTAMRDYDGSITGYLGIAVDITHEQAQKRELLATRDQLSIAASIAELGVWVWHLESNALEWNDRMFEIYEQPKSLKETGLNYQHWRERVHPEDVNIIEDLLLKTVAGEATYDKIFRLLLPSGQVRYIQPAAQIERDEHGKAIRVTGINRDITAQRELENQLRQAKEQAEIMSTSKSSFLANMSHEIRTPMNAVLGMLQLVQHTSLNTRQLDYIVKAETAARSLLGLLNDILDFSKIDAGKLTLENHPFNIEKLMRELGTIIAGNHNNKDVEVLFDISPKLPHLLSGDKLRLQQILINLSSNALKFTAKGFIKISIEQLQQTQTHSRLRFSISDTGIGISPAQQARIFEGFVQAEASTTRRFGGTGLGLSISKRLIEMMGGEINLQSEVGKGSQFSFEIDFALAESTENNDAGIVALPKPNTKILIVDDSTLVTDILAHSLQTVGLRVDVANSGFDAVDQVQKAYAEGQAYDVILMDWHMPDIDGISSAQMIYNNTNQHTPPMIIMITAYEREAIVNQEEQNKLFVDLLTKPVTPQQLLQAINHALAHDNSSQEDPIKHQLQPLAGLHLLVVEDNALNRQIAYELLTNVGAIVDLAEGGIEGVKKIISGINTYDLVIMDIQMPDIDGHEATRRIRADKRFVDLPILAMTANAAVSDKEACLAAGMNGHVGKPIDLNELVINILGLLGKNLPQQTIQAKTAEPSTELLDELNIILGHFGGNQSLFEQLLTKFRAEVIKLLSRIEVGVNSKDPKLTAATLHSLKGVAGTMGAKQLASRASALEKSCKQAAGDELETIVGNNTRHELMNLFEISEAALNSLIKKDDIKDIESEKSISTDHCTESNVNFRVKLEEIMVMLKDSNMEAIDKVAKIYKTQPHNQQLAQLNTQVNDLNYTAAIETLEKLLSNSSL